MLAGADHLNLLKPERTSYLSGIKLVLFRLLTSLLVLHPHQLFWKDIYQLLVVLSHKEGALLMQCILNCSFPTWNFG